MDRQSMDKNHAEANTTGNGGGSRGSGPSAGTIILIIVIVIAAAGWISAFSKTNSRSSGTYSTGAASTSGQCAAVGCDSKRTGGSLYCYEHTCRKSGCTNRITTGSKYCSKHQPETTAAKSTTNKKDKGKRGSGAAWCFATRTQFMGKRTKIAYS